MRFYRFLLHAYPASFQSEYAEEMCALFALRRRDAGGLGLLLWIETIAEVFWNAALVHLDILRQDARYAARTLGRSRGFAATAILVAAIGIGASTAGFTMVDHVLIRPFPYVNEQRLVKLYEDHSIGSGAGGAEWDAAPANYRDWKRMATSFENMAMYHGLAVNLSSDGEPRHVQGASVSSDMFPVLGVTPMLGRGFTPEDDREDAVATVILSNGLWQSTFGGDAGVLGRKILLDGQPYTVIGVMGKDFYFPSRDAELWTPNRFGQANYEDRTDTWVYGIARLKQGVTLSQARAEMTTIARQLQHAWPKELAHVGATVAPLRDDAISVRSRLLLEALFGAALCVLLIACANVANLLMARAMARRKEMAVRAAMGAGAERVVRQMLTESLMLALAGGVLGIGMARAALPLLVRLVPVSLPVAEIPAMDLRVLLFALLTTCGTGVVFGLVPAWRVWRSGASEGLRESARTGGGRREHLRAALVIAEVTISVVLLVSCGLLIRALWRIEAVDPGFRAENVLTLRTSLPMPRYEESAARERFYARVLDEARRLPGVTGVAYTSFLPMVLRGGVWPVEVAGQPADWSSRQTASLRFVTPGFLSTMGIPLLRGRNVNESDLPETQQVAVVSESFVRKYWPGEDPIGRHFHFGSMDRTVVGVVGNVRVRGPEQNSEPQVYLPYRQHDRGVSTWYAPKDLVVRSSGNPVALAPALRRIIHETDPQQPVSDVRMLSDIVEDQTAFRRVQLWVLGAFAVSAFLLASIGIHGLLAFSVSLRASEIGVRMALGAQRGTIVGMVLRDSLRLAAAGIAMGAVLAYAAGQQLRALLAGVPPDDWATFAAAITVCAVMTAAGSLLPALRAVRIDPIVTLRAE